jgi:hypothetical protein
MHYLGFDLETGGFDSKEHTINEAYFAIWDEKWNLIEDLHLYLKNDNGEVKGTPEAFEVTGIDPVEHVKNSSTLTYSEGRKLLSEMLIRNKIPGKKLHYRFLGQNILSFDIPFMEDQGFFTKEDIKKHGIGHNSIDSTVIVTWLKDIGMIPNDVGSISSLIDYLQLEKATAHRAKDDVHMQKEIYVKISNMFKQNMVDKLKTSDVFNTDLLKVIEL